MNYTGNPRILGVEQRGGKENQGCGSATVTIASEAQWLSNRFLKPEGLGVRLPSGAPGDRTSVVEEKALNLHVVGSNPIGPSKKHWPE